MQEFLFNFAFFVSYYTLRHYQEVNEPLKDGKSIPKVPITTCRQQRGRYLQEARHKERQYCLISQGWLRFALVKTAK